VANWLRLGYREQVLAAALRSADGKKSLRFDSQCDGFSKALAAPRDVLFVPELESGKNGCASAAAELELSRNLVIANYQVERSSESQVLSDIELIGSDAAVCFLMDTPVTQGRSYGDASLLFCFRSDSLNISASRDAARRWSRFYESLKSGDTTITEIAKQIVQHASHDVRTSLAIEEDVLCITDLTRRNTPLAAMDFGTETIVVDSRIPRMSAEVNQPTISLWTYLDMFQSERVHLDENSRTLQIDSHPAVAFPTLPADLSHVRAGHQLPLSAYERWELEQLENESLCDVQRPPVPTRRAFKEFSWQGIDIVHVSTHGEAFGRVHDAANLHIVDEEGRQTHLHYNDVLATDLAGIRLVFLNACLTKYGQQWSGDEDLSLAWAFRAAGAKSVIASRWEVPDAACWYFMSIFYDSLLRKEKPIRAAFGDSVRKTQGHLLFAERHVWGHSRCWSNRPIALVQNTLHQRFGHPTAWCLSSLPSLIRFRTWVTLARLTPRCRAKAARDSCAPPSSKARY